MEDRTWAELNKVQYTARLIRRKQIELQELREVAGSTPAVSADQEGGGGNGDRTSALAIRIVQTEEQISRLQDRIVTQIDDLNIKIACLPDEMEQHILSLRFIGHMKFKDIADEIGHSERQMFRIYDRAVQHFTQQLKDVSECQ